MDYYSYMAQQNAVSMIFFVVSLLVVILFIGAIFTTRKSKQYRKEIVDMYVASKTKRLAQQEGLDIVKEYDSFKNWLKEQRLERSDLDDVIESELSEKIQNIETKPLKK